jgi:FdhD protein
MHQTIQAIRLIDDGATPVTCQIAEEIPLALSYNGVPHAVVMASPADLHDLAIGFSLTDGICNPDDITAICQTNEEGSIALDIRLQPASFARFLRTRRRHAQRSFTSCGVCGIESADALPRPAATTPGPIHAPAIRRALADLPAHQPLNRATGAAHAAAWCAPTGEIVLAREDVGRHNALDKLIGARSRLPPAEQQGFCLVTSRCSFEMVQKASVARMGLLVCISAPTAQAIDHARRAGLSLVALARADSQTVYVAPQTNPAAAIVRNGSETTGQRGTPAR